MVESYIVKDSISFLKKLISTSSLSREEDKTASEIVEFFRHRNIPYSRYLNNVWSRSKFFDPSKPTVLLNSHHDTVKPNKGYTRDPLNPTVEDGKLYGLGSNDAGGALVSLMGAFEYFFHRSDLCFNLLFLASAEEEISGKNGVEAVLPKLPSPNFAIVGEPTLMKAAISEKGLMVIDATVKGVAGHAARNEGVNAIYEALQDLEWIKEFQFPKKSETLGDVKQTVTICQSGSQHNVVPDTFNYTIDVRLTDAYTMEEVLDIINENTKASLQPRSMRLKPSFLPLDHDFMSVLKSEGIETYGSPTLSDQALMPFYSLKMGPGDSARSHTADEFIYLHEIEEGISQYVKLLESYNRLLRRKLA